MTHVIIATSKYIEKAFNISHKTGYIDFGPLKNILREWVISKTVSHYCWNDIYKESSIPYSIGIHSGQ